MSSHTTAELDEVEQESAWPAFVDLFAATSLLFITMLGVYIYLAAVREGTVRTTRDDIIRVLEQERAALLSAPGQAADDSISLNASSLFAIDTTERQFVRLVLREKATFPTGRYKWDSLRPEGKRILRLIGSSLGRDSVSTLYREVRVIGHTDQVPYVSDGFTNWELSAARAAVVARFLVSEVSLNPCKISATGRGEFFPDSVSTRKDLEVNRRIEIQIIPRLAGDDGLDAKCGLNAGVTTPLGT